MIFVKEKIFLSGLDTKALPPSSLVASFLEKIYFSRALKKKLFVARPQNFFAASLTRCFVTVEIRILFVFFK